jgi:lipoprotein-anchoring transpeptidase ErfK/SrfK
VDAFHFGSLFTRRFAVSGALVGAAAIAATVFLGSIEPASAQQGYGNFGYETRQRPQRRATVRRRQSASEEQTVAKKDDKKKEAKDNAPKGPVYLVVSLGDQHVSVYDSTGRIASSRVSTGMPGHPTPIGVFSVIGKERWHHSNIYSGAPMPWMQRITWSGVAMHAGVVPGYPASHGCIRLPSSFAPQLYGMTKMGARVIVTRRDTEPFAIAHDFFPLPKMQPAPAATASQQAATSPDTKSPDASVELASLSTPTNIAMTTAAVPDANTSGSAAPKGLLNPIAYAAALKEHAKAEKAVSEKAAKEALEAAQGAGAEARQAADDVSKADAELKAAAAKIAELDATPAAAKEGDASKAKDGEASTAEATEAAAAAKTAAMSAAQSELVRARAALEEARTREAAKSPAAFAAVQVWKAAVTASETAAETLKEADRRSETVSVFVSKKEGRIFIRQDWKEVFEAPVTFRDPDRPLGTHLYIAVEAAPDGSSMRWTAMTVPESSSDVGSKTDRTAKRSSKSAKDDQPELPVAKADTLTQQTEAAAALDQIVLPPGVRERISELLWTGASLIVSDHARSDEMDNDTDFIVQTR